MTFLALYLLAFAALLIWSEWSARYAEDVARNLPVEGPSPGISLIIPVHGTGLDTETCLRSWLEQDYPGDLQVIFSGQDESDPVIQTLEGFRKDEKLRPFEVVIAPVEPECSAKGSNMRHGLEVAKYDWIVFSDADILARRHTLRGIAQQFTSGSKAVSCLIRHYGAQNLWARRYATYWNFYIFGMAGYNLAEGRARAFAGGVMALHKDALETIGGLDAIQNFVAEDVELGRLLEKHEIPRSLGGIVASRVRSMTLTELYDKLRRSQLALRQYPGWPLNQLLSLAFNIGYLFAFIISLVNQNVTAQGLLATFLVFRSIHSGYSAYRESGRFRANLEFLVGDVVNTAAGVSSMLFPTVNWAGEEYKIDGEGRIE